MPVTSTAQRQATAAAPTRERALDRWRASVRWRPVRFALTGGAAGALQLALLNGFEALGAPPLAANAAAFLIAAQANFALSQVFTWADRASAGGLGELARRWARFHATIAGTAALNLLVFALARLVTADLAASALGIAVAAVANFLLADRLVFRPARAGRADGPLAVGSRAPADSRSVRHAGVLLAIDRAAGHPWSAPGGRGARWHAWQSARVVRAARRRLATPGVRRVQCVSRRCRGAGGRRPDGCRG